MRECEEEQVRKLRRASRKFRKLLESSVKRIGRGEMKVFRSITDNDNARKEINEGVIRGYVGVSLVDAGHQAALKAQALGQDHDLHAPILGNMQST